MTDLNKRFAAAAGLILFGAAFLQAHQRSEVFPPRLPLQSFPHQLGDWSGSDRELDKETLQVLGHGEFLSRDYTDPQNRDIDLFVAYFPSQRSNETPHSPQHCLPGAGFTPIENRRLMLSMPGHVPFPANRYIISKGGEKTIVIYWFWAHDRGVASEYWAKYYLVADSIKMNRTDGAMIRVAASMSPGETAQEATDRLLPFINLILPLQNEYIPR
jgi:EpsI family protein